MSVLFVLSLCLIANGQSAKPSEDPESLRQMLAHQPDHIATVTSYYTDSTEGTGRKHRIARLGNRLAEVTEEAIVIKERDKPTLKIFPKRREYSEVLFQDNDDFADLPETYASRDSLVFKSLGREKISNYNCIKIEASYHSEYLADVKFLFWVAPELKGLVLKSERSYGTPYKHVVLLEDISLTVDEAMFRVPANFKKVVEPEL
ncbi:MAG: hypothetical protein QOF62_2475 [Pyrinomonadaceae bacterium]|jgi:hypothetical protein|nr:hypothetical protein [Pyrinomonadaceae bacterium]